MLNLFYTSQPIIGKQLTNLAFEQWVKHVFDHPVLVDDNEKAWYWDIDRDWWEEDTADTIQFLTQAFENAAVILQAYSDAQLKQGLWFIADNSCSDHMFALLNESVPWPARQRCLRSIHQIYEQCFLPRCTPHLSHINEPGTGAVNMVCYMRQQYH